MNVNKNLIATATALVCGVFFTPALFAQSLGEASKGSTVTGTRIKAFGEGAYLTVVGTMAQTTAGKGKVGTGPVGLESSYSETKESTLGHIDTFVVDIQGSTVTNSDIEATGKLSNSQAKADGAMCNDSVYARN